MKRLIDEMDELADVMAETASNLSRETKDSGKREELSNGFKRDTQDGKFKFSEQGIVLIEEFLKVQDIDNEQALNTDYDMDIKDHRYKLIHDLMLNRIQALLERGAEKYGAWNWQRGAPMSRVYDSLFRHLIQAYLGDTSEDHLAAVGCNLMFLMVYEHQLHTGKGFMDEDGTPIGKFSEFADAGALFLDDERYNMPNGANDVSGDEERKYPPPSTCGWCGASIPAGHDQCVDVAGVLCNVHEEHILKDSQLRSED